MIVERGEAGLDALPKGLREDRGAMAETIENNVRRLIIDEMAVNPKYYEKMSQLLDALILQRKQEALNYKEYLARIVALARQVGRPEAETLYPSSINSHGLRALFDNLEGAWRERSAEYSATASPEARERKALALDRAIRGVKG
jgi:type I restriction enzyme R subunit